jgi:3-phytase
MAFPGSVTADAQTPDVPGTGDFSDDPAILIHPTTPASSVLVTSNKDYTNGGLYAYDISTSPTLTDTEDSGTAFNNVDLRYNLGSLDNVIGATNREAGTIDFFTYDFAATSDEMESVGSISTGFTNEPYGFAMGRLATSTGEKFYAFASEDNGSTVKQWELTESAGVVSGTLVRTITVPNSTQVEGIVIDDVNGDLYIAEEDYGIYKYGTDPASGSTYTTVDTVSGGNLTADVEGMSIYYGDNGTGYLIASSQFESKYAVYELQGSNTYLGKFSLSGNGSTIDAVTKTDGLDVTNVNLGTAAFDEGLFVAHDGENTSNDSSNFKLIEFDEIANLGGLTLDASSYDPRAALPVTAPAAPAFFTINTTDAATITYTGTSANDTLTGTSAPEYFNGLAGSDTYNGSTGDDQYVISEAGDTIASDTGGQDTVELWYTGNYTMSSNMEHVVVQGSTNRTVTGNADNNIMSASGTSSGTMTFLGMTGDDNIRVGTRDVAATGGADNDIFRYSTNAATGAGNTISDFTWGDDLIDASPLVAGSYAPTSDPFANGVLSLVDSGSDVKLMWDQDGSANSTVAAVEVVTILGVQIDAGINNAHIYTGL